MMKGRRCVVTVSAVAALAILTLGTDARAFEGFPPGKWWKSPEIATQLKLSPSQVAEIEKLFIEDRTRLIDLKAELEKRELELEALLEGDVIDRQALEGRIDRVNEAKAALNKARLLMQVRVWQVLNPEQRGQIRAWQEARRARHPGPPGRPRPPDKHDPDDRPKGKKGGPAGLPPIPPAQGIPGPELRQDDDLT